MNPQALESPAVQALGWTLLHFLWQGALIALVASILFRLMRGGSANARYLVACGMLALCVVAPLVTFLIFDWPAVQATSFPMPKSISAPNRTPAVVASQSKITSSLDSSSQFSVRTTTPHIVVIKTSLDALVPWLVPVWLVGIIAMTLRLVLGWACIQSWRRSATLVTDAVLRNLFARLCDEMELVGRATLLVSDKINVPVALGWLRPVILFPGCILTGLSPDELRAVLAHELAHIRRHDYLVNLLQSFVEVMLFYHPAVWWISRRVREVREECCDEAALRAGADRIAYARALAGLAELSLGPAPALSAKGGSLFHRIARLLGKAESRPASSRDYAASLLSLAGVLLIAMALFHSSRAQAQTEPKADSKVAAFREAVSKNDVKKAAQLLGQGIDLKAPSFAPLVLHAATFEQYDMLNLLLEHGADINARDKDGQGPLDNAINGRQDDMARYLIEHGADLNHPDRYGSPPTWQAAMEALYSNSAATLELLKKKGAKFTGQNKDGATIFTYFLHTVPPGSKFPDEKSDSPEVVQKKMATERHIIEIIIAGGADINELDSWLGETPLTDSLDGQHYAAARALLAAGADVNKPDSKGNAPILFSVLRGWGLPLPTDIIKILLEKGADPNARTKGVNIMGSMPQETTSALQLLLEHRDYGPIDPASDQNQNEVFALLWKHGARFVAESAVQELLHAAATGDLAALQGAVAKGASVNSTDADGWSPLMVALSLGHEDCVRWLLAHGADVKTKNAQRYSPLFFAVIRQQAGRVDDFLAKGADPNCGKGLWFEGKMTTVGSALWCSVYLKNTPIFKSLINAGAKATPAEIDKAIQFGQVEMVRALLEKGSPPDDVKPYENRGSVYWAVYYNQPKILQMLLNHGADPELKTDYNETPLSMAQESNKSLVPVLEAAIKKRHAASK